MSQIEVKNGEQSRLTARVAINSQKSRVSPKADAYANEDIKPDMDSLPKLRILMKERIVTRSEDSSMDSSSQQDARWTSPRISKQRSAQKQNTTNTTSNNQSYSQLKSVINEKVFKDFKEHTQMSLAALLPNAELQVAEEMESAMQDVIKEVKVSVSKLQSSSVNNVFLNKAIHDFNIDTIKDILLPYKHVLNKSPDNKNTPSSTKVAAEPPTPSPPPVPTNQSPKNKVKKRVLPSTNSDEDYVPYPNEKKKRNTGDTEKAHTRLEEQKLESKSQSAKTRDDIMIVNSLNTSQNATIMPPPRQTKVLSTMREKLRAKRLQKDAEKGNLRLSDSNSTPNSTSETASPNDLLFNGNNATPNNVPFGVGTTTQSTPNSQQGFQDDFNKFASSTSSMSPISNGIVENLPVQLEDMNEYPSKHPQPPPLQPVSVQPTSASLASSVSSFFNGQTPGSATTITTDINSAVKIISAASGQCTQITTSNGQTTKAFIIDGSQLTEALALLQSMNPNVQVTQQQFVLLPGSEKGEMRLQNINGSGGSGEASVIDNFINTSHQNIQMVPSSATTTHIAPTNTVSSNHMVHHTSFQPLISNHNNNNVGPPCMVMLPQGHQNPHLASHHMAPNVKYNHQSQQPQQLLLPPTIMSHHHQQQFLQHVPLGHHQVGYQGNPGILVSPTSIANGHPQSQHHHQQQQHH